MKRPVDVLILTAPFGNGHNSASQAIQEELEKTCPDLTVQTVDLFDITTPKLKDYFAETYDVLTRTQPGIYNRLYDLRTKIPFNPIDGILYKLTFEHFLEFVLPIKPKIILSVFPTGTAFASAYKKTVDESVRLITCITDVVDNWEWVYPNTDLYLVATESVKSRLMDKSVADEKILVTGVPVRQAFKCAKDNDGEPMKKDMRLLILANAMETVNIDDRLLAQLAQIKHLHTVIITGNQTKLFDRLSQLNHWSHIEVLGYVENMAEYMAQSDLIISKAGGATIFEAIEMELPLLIRQSRVGQESKNVSFVQEAGIGELAPSDDMLSSRVLALLKNRQSIRQYQKNIRSVKRTLNQGEIGPRILNLLTDKGSRDNRVS